MSNISTVFCPSKYSTSSLYSFLIFPFVIVFDFSTNHVAAVSLSAASQSARRGVRQSDSSQSLSDLVACLEDDELTSELLRGLNESSAVESGQHESSDYSTMLDYTYDYNSGYCLDAGEPRVSLHADSDKQAARSLSPVSGSSSNNKSGRGKSPANNPANKFAQAPPIVPRPVLMQETAAIAAPAQASTSNPQPAKHFPQFMHPSTTSGIVAGSRSNDIGSRDNSSSAKNIIGRKRVAEEITAGIAETAEADDADMVRQKNDRLKLDRLKLVRAYLLKRQKTSTPREIVAFSDAILSGELNQSVLVRSSSNASLNSKDLVPASAPITASQAVQNPSKATTSNVAQKTYTGGETRFADWKNPSVGIPHKARMLHNSQSEYVLHPKYYMVRVLGREGAKDSTSEFFYPYRNFLQTSLHWYVDAHAAKIKEYNDPSSDLRGMAKVVSELHSWPRALVNAHLGAHLFDEQDSVANAWMNHGGWLRHLAGIIDEKTTLAQMNSSEMRIKILSAYLLKLEQRLVVLSEEGHLVEAMTIDHAIQNVKSALESEKATST